MKTPKEKAKKITDIYAEYVTSDINRSKLCAIITVDQIIQELQSYSDLKSVIVIDDIDRTVINRIIYWNKVKREINRL